MLQSIRIVNKILDYLVKVCDSIWYSKVVEGVPKVAKVIVVES